MYPHERSLVKKLEGKPFALIGINSDTDRDKIKERIDAQLAAGATDICLMPLRCDDVPLRDERALEAFAPR